VGVDELRRRAATGLIEGALRGLHPAARALRQGVEVVRGVPYRANPGPAHTLDLYRPRSSEGPLPVALYVHGGGFSILSKDTHWMFGLLLAQRGFLVASIDYRLAPKHPFPAALTDASDALVWLVRNAAAWGGDPERLIYAGESAGGNLALSLAIAGCWERPEPYAQRVWEVGARPRAVLPACGFLQVSHGERYLERQDLSPIVRSRIAAICQGYLPDSAGDHALADPLVFLEQAEAPARELPAIQAICGTADPVLDDTVRLGEALERYGDAHEALLYDGAIHAFHAFFWLPNAVDAWLDIERFLVRHVPGARRHRAS
jgi:acetyl esterase